MAKVELVSVNILNQGFTFQVEIGGVTKYYQASIKRRDGDDNMGGVLEKVKNFTLKFVKDLGEMLEKIQDFDFSKTHLQRINYKGIQYVENTDAQQRKIRKTFDEIFPFVERVKSRDEYRESFGLQNNKIIRQAKTFPLSGSFSEAASDDGEEECFDDDNCVFPDDGSSTSYSFPTFTRRVWDAVCDPERPPLPSSLSPIPSLHRPNNNNQRIDDRDEDRDEDDDVGVENQDPRHAIANRVLNADFRALAPSQMQEYHYEDADDESDDGSVALSFDTTTYIDLTNNLDLDDLDEEEDDLFLNNNNANVGQFDE